VAITLSPIETNFFFPCKPKYLVMFLKAFVCIIFVVYSTENTVIVLRLVLLAA